MCKKLVLATLFSLTFTGLAFSAPVFDDSVQPANGAQTTQELLFKKQSNRNSFATKLLQDQQASMMKVNIACGIPPIPPIGCRAACFCDQSGSNCQWTFICN